MKFNGKTLSVAAEFVDVGGNPLQYATVCDSLFSGAQFPDGLELVVYIPNIGSSMNSMFRKSTGLKKLTLRVPTNKTYNAGYFFFGTAEVRPPVQEIVLPDGIKFSDFGRFAGYCNYLTTIAGSIDLSECTVTTYCFMDCRALRDVQFVPRTICKSIDFSNCPNLSDASIRSIIGGLNPYVSEQTLTVHPTVAAKITATDVTDAGWELAY